MYSGAELAVLGDFARICKAGSPETLYNAVTPVAKLGGYLNRKYDGPPRFSGTARSASRRGRRWSRK
ncbi:MAG: hypothetical protein OXC26_06170 [Albidovulum sp.]|nr:hypothetical protein [Albidovulum sp.]